MMRLTPCMLAIALCALGAPGAQAQLTESLPPAAESQPAPPAPSPPQSQPTRSDPTAECEALATPPVPLAISAAAEKARIFDWDRAIQICEQAVGQHAADPHLEYLLGHAYYKAKGYMQAMRHYQIAADAGYAAADDELGVLFVMGLGVVKDYQRAFDLFNKAAAGGSPSGMSNLGSMFANGYFVKEDDAKALDWYERSIGAGNAFGLAEAGVMYFNGKGTPVDYGMAAQYFQQSADLGDGYSLKFLALMYERGLLGKPDPAKASELRLKAAQVDPDSQDPNVSPARSGGQARRGGGSGSGSGGRAGQRSYASGGGNGGGYLRPSGHGVVGVWADPNANRQGYTGTVKRAPTWHGISVSLPRCWPMCSATR